VKGIDMSARLSLFSVRHIAKRDGTTFSTRCEELIICEVPSAKKLPVEG
jgi:hypothetical protein